MSQATIRTTPEAEPNVTTRHAKPNRNEAKLRNRRSCTDHKNKDRTIRDDVRRVMTHGANRAAHKLSMCVTTHKFFQSATVINDKDARTDYQKKVFLTSTHSALRSATVDQSTNRANSAKGVSTSTMSMVVTFSEGALLQTARPLSLPRHAQSTHCARRGSARILRSAWLQTNHTFRGDWISQEILGRG